MRTKNIDEFKIKPHYDALFHFIRKNTILVEAINAVSDFNPLFLNNPVNQLLNAIQTGNFEANIFKDDKVDIYLLYLIKENKINLDPELNFWTGMTIYFYILSLRQYGKHLSLIPTKDNCKLEVEIEVLSFFEEGKVTQECELYLKVLSKTLSKFQIHLDVAQAIDFISKLPPAEQKIIKLSDTYYSNLLESVKSDLPFIFPQWDLKNQRYYSAYVPSMSFINYLVTLQSPAPIWMTPILGCINEYTLSLFYRDRIHPIAVSSTLVKSNLIAHNSTDASAIFVHDIAHTFMSNLLPKEDYVFLFKYLIPMMKEWRQFGKLHQQDPDFVKYLRNTIEIAEDLALEPLNKFRDPRTRLANFIFIRFSLDQHLDKNPDKFFFLLVCIYFSHNWEKETKEKWLKIISNILHERFNGRFIWNAHLIKALLIIASNNPNIAEELEEETKKLPAPYNNYLQKFISCDIKMNYEEAIEKVKESSPKIITCWLPYLKKCAIMATIPPTSLKHSSLFKAAEKDNVAEEALGKTGNYWCQLF